MRVRAFLLPAVLLGAAACAEQPGPPDLPAPGEPSAELVADEVSEANNEAEGALRLSRLVLGKLSDPADLKDQATAVQKVATGMGAGPGACAASSRVDPAEPGVIYVTFDRCPGPFDARTITGTLRFAFGKAPGVPGLRVQVDVAPGATLAVQGTPIARYHLEATLSFPALGATRMAWEVAWERAGGGGVGGGDLRLWARFNTLVRSEIGDDLVARECSTTSGRASFQSPRGGFSFDVDDYRLCREPLRFEPVCPESGTWSVTDDDAASRITFAFTGETAPAGPDGRPRALVSVVDAGGAESRVELPCGGGKR